MTKALLGGGAIISCRVFLLALILWPLPCWGGQPFFFGPLSSWWQLPLYLGMPPSRSMFHFSLRLATGREPLRIAAGHHDFLPHGARYD
jgi:hypothetical protein